MAPYWITLLYSQPRRGSRPLFITEWTRPRLRSNVFDLPICLFLAATTAAQSEIVFLWRLVQNVDMMLRALWPQKIDVEVSGTCRIYRVTRGCRCRREGGGQPWMAKLGYLELPWELLIELTGIDK